MFLLQNSKISKIQNNKYRYLFDICYFKLPKIQDFKHFQNNKLLIRGSYSYRENPRSRRSRTSNIDICYFKLPKIQDSKYFQNNKLLIRGSFDRTHVLIPKIPRSRRSKTTFEKIQDFKHFQNNKLLIRGSLGRTRIPKIPRSRRSRTTFEKIQDSKPFQDNKSLVLGSFEGVTCSYRA